MKTHYGTYSKRGGVNLRGTSLALAALSALLLVASLLPMLASPAKAQEATPEGLTKVGPINPESGYPYWYEDANGARLDLCLDPQDQKCLQPFESPNPEQPVSFPDNFPGESFYWAGETSTTINDGNGDGDALLVMALEAAFANDEVEEGDQMSFGRIRVRIDNLELGETYRVSHPYGTDTYVATDDGTGGGEINVTEDIGCFPTARLACDFDDARSSRVGPFLTWTTFGDKSDPALEGANGEPDAYVGDPGVAGGHQVKGSPINDGQGNPQNYFKVERRNAAGGFEQIGNTDTFAVSGKLATPQVEASPREKVFNDPQDVTLVPSDPAYEVYYTDDPAVADADIATAGTPYDPNQPIHLEGVDGQVEKTTLRFLAVEPASGQQSEVTEKTYTIDRAAPNLSADPDSGTYETSQKVTLSSNDALAKIYYTTDGSSPVDADDNATGTEYTEPFDVDRTQQVKAVAIDEDGNQSQVKTFKYTISSLSATGPINPQGGYPFWYEDANGVKLDLCLDPRDQMCLQPFEMPDPTADKVSFPDNFPGESFWWTGETSTTTDTGADAQLVLALEAAFANDEVEEGDQMSFGRIRVRVDDLETGQEYRVTHPYGTDTYVATDDGKGAGEINVTEDLGCFPTANLKCDFDDARFGRVGPFLTWDSFGTDSPDAPPAGYVGDPNIEGGHKVTGSPVNDGQDNPQNYFKVEKVNAGGSTQQVAYTDMFSISGKLSELQVGPSVTGGFYNTPQEVTLGASEEGANIFYTLDGSEPTTGGTQYSGPITIDAMNQETTLKFIAVDANGNQSKVFTETYTLDNVAPTISATPEPGTYDSVQSVTLEASEAGAIYYTTNGSEPTKNSTRYEDPIRVDTTQTVKAIAVDRAGNESDISSLDYVVQLPTSTSLNSDSATIEFGDATTLSGKLTAGDEPLADKEITLIKRAIGDNGFSPVPDGQLTTDAQGNFSLSGVSPDKNTYYRARFDGIEGGLERSISGAERVNVRADVRLNVARDKISNGRRIGMGGIVRPDHVGDEVRLIIKRGGQRIDVKTVTLNENSRYRFVYRPPGIGRYAVRAVFPKQDADHLGNSSQLERFRVTR